MGDALRSPMDMPVLNASARVAAAEPARLRTLMAAAQDGDAESYAVLLRECVPLIRRMARQNGIRADAVDDVVQDTLMTIHRARHTFDPARPFSPWLRAIVQRRGVDSMRRMGRHAARERYEPAAYEAHADQGPDAEQHVAARSRADRLAAAVELLPPGQREALEHLGLRERSLSETATLTGRSTGALKVNLHRAIKSLRAIMGPHEP